MEFQIGQRVKFLKYWEGTGTVESLPGDLSSQFYIVRGNADAGPAFNMSGGFTADELEDASCCGNQHERCDECPLMPDGQPLDCGGDCLGDTCATCPFRTISGREGKPRTGSEVMLLRESTAPNADRIARLEAKVASLESFENGAVPRIAALEDKVQELTDALADQQRRQQVLIQTMAASIGSIWLDKDDDWECGACGAPIPPSRPINEPCSCRNKS